MEAGLNLYSVRNLIGTEEGLIETAKKLKEMGYSYLQFSGAPYDAEKIKRTSSEAGLPVYLTHVPYDRIINDTERLMEEHASFGCRNIGLGKLPKQTFTDEDEFKKAVKSLNSAAEKMAQKGFKFFYHNHHVEFLRLGGSTLFDYMAQNAPAVNFTLDTYWLQYGGADILSTVGRLEGRIGCVHLKDYKIVCDENGGFSPAMAPLGEGVLDFSRIIPAMRAGGTLYFFVEQDNAASAPDTLSEVKKSIDYLKKF